MSSPAGVHPFLANALGAGGAHEVRTMGPFLAIALGGGAPHAVRTMGPFLASALGGSPLERHAWTPHLVASG